MNAAAKHTPGPWRVVRNWRGKIAIVGPSNNGIDTTSGRICNVPTRPDGSGEVDAAHIVKACNAHTELVAALESAQPCLAHNAPKLSESIARLLAKVQP